jgi:hypothetical protein
VLEALEETAHLYQLIQPSQLSDSQIAELRTHLGARW